MDSEGRWAAIAAHRRAVVDLLRGLDEAQWEAPSLCAEWRVRDVVAHMTCVAEPPPPAAFVSGLVRSRGNVDVLNTRMTRERAERPTARLVDDLLAHADSRRMPAVTNEKNILFDLLTHGQDIAIPLGLDLPVPLEAGADGATRVWTMGWPFWARRRLRGLHLSATDVTWSAGEGEEVRGPIRAMLLLLTGRTAAALPMLDGPGVARLAAAARTGGR